jgi:hypothetical protein
MCHSGTIVGFRRLNSRPLTQARFTPRFSDRSAAARKELTASGYERRGWAHAAAPETYEYDPEDPCLLHLFGQLRESAWVCFERFKVFTAL